MKKWSQSKYTDILIWCVIIHLPKQNICSCCFEVETEDFELCFVVIIESRLK